MFGSITEFFYKNLAGIEPSSPGYKEISISPQLVGDLTHASATVQTMYGEIGSKWEKQGNSIIFNINIPANTKAKLVLQKNAFKENIKLKESDTIIWEKGQLKSQVDGIELIQELSDCFKITIMSGSYNFILSGS
jgi:alpha-L-rhamnosidase